MGPFDWLVCLSAGLERSTLFILFFFSFPSFSIRLQFLHTEQQLLSFKRVTIGTLKNEIFLFFLNLHAQEEQKEKEKLSFISPVIY